ncbi:MAG: serine protein kinase RIO [Chloroflexota bacterium]
MLDDLLLEDDIEDEEGTDPLIPFVASGLITEVLGELKSGKEGTTFCCKAHPSTGYDYLAAKVYRPRETRSFKNDSMYREGEVVLNARDARAMKRKSDWGREVSFGSWIFHEYETLTRLSEAGADVPRPIMMAGNAMLMEFVGDGSSAAPPLHSVRLAEEEARPLFQRTLANVELMLRLNLIHGDLSAYNILYRNGEITLIDFPQAFDPRTNRQALDLLIRDVENVCRYFGKYGIKHDAIRYAQYLWEQFLRMDL